MRSVIKEKVVWQYFCLTTFYYMSVLMTGGVYVTYLQEHGMSLLQVNLINSVFFITLFVCEIPTGAFADTFGRKHSIVAACLIRGIGAIMYGASDTFVGFLVAEVISALGTTFMNGALNAWLIDSLLHCGYDRSVINTKLFASGVICGQITGGLISIVGSHLGMYSMRLPWIVEGSIGIITGIVAYRILREDYFIRGLFSWRQGLLSMREIAIRSFRYASTDNAVRFILMTNFLQILSVQTFNMHWQPFFGELGVSKLHFGAIFLGVQIALAAGAIYTMYGKIGEHEKLGLIGSQIVVGILIFITLLMPNWKLTVLFFVLHEAGRGLWRPLMASYLHKRIPSHERATIDSFCQISPHIGGTIGLVISGVIAEYGGIPIAWIASSFLLIIGSLFLARHAGGKNV